jgi:hypothetical protein
MTMTMTMTTMPFALFRSALLQSSVARQTCPSLYRHLSIHKTDRRSVRNSSRLLALASASCLFHWQSSRTTNTTTCQSSSNNNKRRSVPPQFGTSVRYKHASSSISETNDSNEDCPICRKYSQGPCGTIFRQWLTCTDANKGIDPETKQEWHLTKCSHLATPLAQCLQKHESYYENLDIYNEDDDENENDDMKDLKEAWQNVIKEVEQKDRQSFPPEIVPELQVRPTTNTGMAAFVYQYKEKTLILAYVKDNDTGELLAAGSLEDLWEWEENGYGVLRLALPETTRSVTAYALYQADTPEEEILYVKPQRVPPRTPTR